MLKTLPALALALSLTGCASNSKPPAWDLATGWNASRDHDIVLRVRSKDAVAAEFRARGGTAAQLPLGSRLYGFHQTGTNEIWIARDSLQYVGHEVRHIEDGDWHK